MYAHFILIFDRVYCSGARFAILPSLGGSFPVSSLLRRDPQISDLAKCEICLDVVGRSTILIERFLVCAWHAPCNKRRFPDYLPFCQGSRMVGLY
jgi:hypothetical protein